MDLRELKALVSIAEVGTLSGAAQKLNLTQPGLSALLKRLEEDLNVTLVSRHARGVAFTEEGKYLLERAYVILNEVMETKTSLNDILQEPVGIVRVGIPTTIAGGLIPTLLPAIHKRYPRIQLHFTEAMSGGLLEMLQLGRLDLAMLFDIQPMPGLRSEPILVEEMCLMVPSDDPMADLRSASIDDVAQRELVLPSGSHFIRELIDRAASAEGLQLKVVADVDSFHGLTGLVLSGYPTVLPSYLLMDDIRAGRLHAIPILRPKLEWTVNLATRQDIMRPRATTVVGKMLIDTCIASVKSGIWPARVHRRQRLQR